MSTGSMIALLALFTLLAFLAIAIYQLISVKRAQKIDEHAVTDKYRRGPQG